MPIYEYECSSCEKIIEEFQDMDEKPLKKCKCGGKLKRLISLSSSDVNYKNAKEMFEKVIKPDAKRIAQKIKDGDEEEAANFFGVDE